MTSIHSLVTEKYAELFNNDPQYVVRAPGRVNLIGEHTDYNDGFVLPMAIERATWIAASPTTDGKVTVHLLDFDQTVEFALDAFDRQGNDPIEYIKGVTWALQESGYELTGWRGVIAGDVPIGAGLSSSAALEIATARVFQAVSKFDWDVRKMALLGQKAENDWIGAKTGIMDQMISAAGEDGHAVLIDCRSLELASVPLPLGTTVVILDSSTRRGLVGSAYNERREQCEQAAEHFGVPKLRDLSLDQFEPRKHELDDVVMRRAKHIITENERTLQASEAMRANDPVKLGQLMIASHESMRDDFEISTDALNAIVECSLQHKACYGARMTGGGFGGCGVALVKVNQVDNFVEFVTKCYTEKTGHTAKVYVSQPMQGAEIVLGD